MSTVETCCPTSVAHLEDVPWYSAPIPPAGHECWRQSWHTNENGLLWLERCPCGGARVLHPTAGSWFGHNTRATGRALSPSVIRLAAAQAHRRASRHERQVVVTGDRQVIQCTYLASTAVADCGARAWVVTINPASNHDRIAVLVRARDGRWAQRWESIQRLGDFRVALLPVGHPHHGDRRLRTFADDEAKRFLDVVTATPAPRADAAAAMARVHAGGSR
ncbi:hypothetical protein [Lentzea sp. NPDC092896]|uniref:hypothetical protein n=1 Tax=Lentzea sp. NPDC092896 TaxID=3364127 RepID=UPI0038195B09